MSRISRVIALSRRRPVEGGHPLWRQMGEMAVLRMLRGVGPSYYHRAGLWKQGLSWDHKTGHLSPKEYRRRVDQLNPAEYRKLSQNKIPEKAILTLFGIPTPAFIGRLHARHGCDREGQPLRTAVDLERLIKQRQAHRLVIKPLEGSGGRGVHVPIIEHDESITFKDVGRSETCSVSTYCADALDLGGAGDWIVEEYFEQHPVLSGINPTSVNTVRIWMLDRGEAGYQTLLAYLRIGRRDMVVDNTSSGGMAAPIDLDSGTLRPARDACAEHNVYARHPDNNAPIEGIVLPYWSEVQAVAARTLSAFPNIRFAGLDVAIGPSGTCILELNVFPDRIGAADANCPLKGIL